MKLSTFFLCTFSLLLTARAESPKKSGETPASALSLNAVTESVLANNPSIKEARAKWEAMKQRVPQARAWEDLKVSGSTLLGRFVQIGPNGFTDQMLSVEQMIPISGKNQSRARIAAAEALGALEEVRRKELDAVAKARTSFFRLARDCALLELVRANESSLHQTFDIGRAKFEVGGQSQAELLTAENEVTKNEEARHDLLRSISEDETQLKVLMNRDPFAPLGKPVVPLPDAAHEHLAVDHLRALLFSNRPEVRMAEAGITGAKAKLELARREWIPDPAISVEAQRYNGGSQAVSEVSAGISFSVPWLNGKKYRAGETEAANGVEAAQHALDAARIEALGLLRDQLQKIETFHHHVELFGEKLIPTARQTVEANRTNYESGQATFLELEVSQRSLFDLESMQREHRADYEMALAELEAIVGADLNLFSPGRETSKRKTK
jgi:outer membrane protein, heavy metal efflux system